jgi:uncharacterized protein YcnI
MLRRTVAVLALLTAGLVGLAAPAGAHTELEPSEATAGATETLTFNVAYEGAGTTGLEVQLPDGATLVEIPDKPGWTSTSDSTENTVTWTGGPVEADESFAVVVELPDTTGEVLFPAIQSTTDGEVAWIDPEESEGHDSFPAPRLTLVADPNATTSTTEASTTTTEAVTTTTADLPGTTLEAADDGDDDSAAPWLIGAGIAAIVVIGVGGWLLKRRQDAERATAAEAAAPSEVPGPSDDGPAAP